MLFRSFLLASLAVGAALGWIMAAGPSFTLGLIKTDLVNAYEKAGVDTRGCKASRTLLDPSGDMEGCMKGVFEDIQRQLEEESGSAFGDDFERVEEPSIE